MGIFLGKRKSNLLKKLVAPVVLSSSLFSSANAMYHSWKMEEEGVGFVFNDKSNILWINGIGEKRHLCDNNKKMVKLINDKISKLNNNNEGIEIRFAKKGIIGICDFKFSKIKKIKKISFPDGFEIIKGEMVFEDCSELEEINFPKKMVSLVSSFRNCKKLKRIVLPERHDDLPYYFNFDGCENLKIVEFPKEIGKLSTDWANTFKNCYNLCEIKNFPKLPKLEDEQIYLFDGTFRNCKALDCIVINSDEKLKLFGTFKGCRSARYIYAENVHSKRKSKFDTNLVDNCSNLVSLRLKITKTSRVRPIEKKNTPNLISIDIERMEN